MNLQQNQNIKDYFNDMDLGEVAADKPTIKVAFKDFLLVQASPVN